MADTSNTNRRKARMKQKNSILSSSAEYQSESLFELKNKQTHLPVESEEQDSAFEMPEIKDPPIPGFAQTPAENSGVLVKLANQEGNQTAKVNTNLANTLKDLSIFKQQKKASVGIASSLEMEELKAQSAQKKLSKDQLSSFTFKQQEPQNAQLYFPSRHRSNHLQNNNNKNVSSFFGKEQLILSEMDPSQAGDKMSEFVLGSTPEGLNTKMRGASKLDEIFEKATRRSFKKSPLQGRTSNPRTSGAATAQDLDSVDESDESINSSQESIDFTEIDSTNRQMIKIGTSSSDESLSVLEDSVRHETERRKTIHLETRDQIKKKPVLKAVHLEEKMKKKNKVDQFWTFLIGVLCLITSFEYCFAAAFILTFSKRELDNFEARSNFYTLMFSIDLIAGFIKSLINLNEAQKENEKKEKISMFALAIQVILNQLLVDLFPLIPFHSVMDSIIGIEGHIFYLTKITRIFKAFRVLNYKELIQYLKDMQILRIKRKTHLDSSEKFIKISDIVLFAQLLKTLRLIGIIITLSFLSAICCYIFCEIGFKYGPQGSDFFLEEYGLEENSNLRNSILLTYYMFTTFSTVGLGDFHPKNSSERLLSAATMLFGVMMTSFLIENFSKVLDQLKNFNKTHSEAESLILFIGTMKKFNQETPLTEEQESKIQSYFKYRWLKDRNLAVSTRQDEELLEQFPSRLVVQLFSDYLFKDFMERFKNIFEIRQKIVFRRISFLKKFEAHNLAQNIKFFDPNKVATDDIFEDFLVNFLRWLEPISLREGEVIQKIDQQVDMIHFLSGCEIEIGYNHRKFMFRKSMSSIQSKSQSAQSGSFIDLKREISRQVFNDGSNSLRAQKYLYPLCFYSNQPVGFFEVMYQQQSLYQYRIKVQEKDKDSALLDLKQHHCLFMREINWRKLWIKFFDPAKTEQIQLVENQILFNYIESIYFPMRDFQEIQSRLELDSKSEVSNKQQMAKSMINLLKPSRGPSSRADSNQSLKQFASSSVGGSGKIPSKFRVKSMAQILRLMKESRLTIEYDAKRQILEMQSNDQEENEPLNVEEECSVIGAKFQTMYAVCHALLQEVYKSSHEMAEQKEQSKQTILALREEMDRVLHQKEFDIIQIQASMSEKYKELQVGILKEQKANKALNRKLERMIRKQSDLIKENIDLRKQLQDYLKEFQKISSSHRNRRHSGHPPPSSLPSVRRHSHHPSQASSANSSRRHSQHPAERTLALQARRNSDNTKRVIHPIEYAKRCHFNQNLEKRKKNKDDPSLKDYTLQPMSSTPQPNPSTGQSPQTLLPQVQQKNGQLLSQSSFSSNQTPEGLVDPTRQPSGLKSQFQRLMAQEDQEEEKIIESGEQEMTSKTTSIKSKITETKRREEEKDQASGNEFKITVIQQDSLSASNNGSNNSSIILKCQPENQETSSQSKKPSNFSKQQVVEGESPGSKKQITSLIDLLGQESDEDEHMNEEDDDETVSAEMSGKSPFPTGALGSPDPKKRKPESQQFKLSMKDLKLLKSLKKKKQSDIAVVSQMKNDSSPLPPIQIRRGSNLPPSRVEYKDNISHELESHITEDLSHFENMKSEHPGLNKYGVYSQMSKEDMMSIAEDIQILDDESAMNRYGDGTPTPDGISKARQYKKRMYSFIQSSDDLTKHSPGFSSTNLNTMGKSPGYQNNPVASLYEQTIMEEIEDRDGETDFQTSVSYEPSPAQNITLPDGVKKV